MKRIVLFALLMLGIGAGQGSAQAAWDSPLLLPPLARDGIGVFVMDAEGGGIGLMALYRSPIWNYGLRAGIAESGRDNRISVFGGIDYAGTITRATPDFPLDVEWVFGAGLSFDETIRVSVPVGLTTGHAFRADGATFTPYATPRIVFDGYIGGERPGRRNALELAVDLGLDMELAAGFTVRFGATIGRREAVALGIHF
jgi:hypothetical protein